LVGFLDRHAVDFVVIDEIHYGKQRDAGMLMSKRKRLVQGLVLVHMEYPVTQSVAKAGQGKAATSADPGSQL
jgi:hypothetical protein